MTGPAYTHITVPVPTVGEVMLPPEPPAGSIVRNHAGHAWACRDGRWWWQDEGMIEVCDYWPVLNEAHGPVILERWGP